MPLLTAKILVGSQIRVRVQSSAFASGPRGVLRRIALDACDVEAPSGWKIACTAD
jgi:hypothetical protein